MIEYRQCHSLKEDKTRCTNPTIGTSLHCTEHIKNAKKLYTKYKSVSEYIKSIDMHKHFDNDKDKVEHLKQYHSLILETFFARFKHRYYTIAPECHDDGHNYQFMMLQNKLAECETAMSELQVEHDKILLEVSKQIRSVEMTKENLMTNKFMILGMKYNMFKQNTLEKVLLKMNIGMWTPKYFKVEKKPVRDKKVLNYVVKMKKDNVKMLVGNEGNIKDDIPVLVPVNDILEQVNFIPPIKINKKYEKQLKKLVVAQTKPVKQKKGKKKGKKKEEPVLPVKVVVKHVDKKTLLSQSIVKQLILMYDITEKDNIYIYLMCLTHLINELDRIKFLDDDFEPKMCDECDCDKVVTYNISFNCECHLQFKTIADYFSSTGNKELTKINGDLKLHFKKLSVLCMDIKELFDRFGYYIFKIPLDLSWDYREDVDRYRVKFGGRCVSDESESDESDESESWGVSDESWDVSGSWSDSDESSG
jgi:hypothetical protein